MYAKKDINFAWPVTTLCKFDYDALRKCVEANEEVLRQKQIVIFGAGIRGTSFSLLLQKFGFSDMVFTDNNKEKIGGNINDFPIIPYEEVETDKEHLVVIISVENGFSIKEQLEKSGFIENVNYFYVENHLYDIYMDKFNNNRAIDTLVIGDCALTDISKGDKDYTNLEEMLEQKLGEDKTKVLAIHGMALRSFYHILCAHLQFISIPKTVVIMTNPVTIGKHHLLPRAQHADLIQVISNAVNNQDSELKDYVGVTRERFNNLKMDFFTSSQSVLNKMSKDKNDKIVIRLNYMYELKEDNECLVYMKKIVDLCRQKNTNLLFFIPPVNYMYAEELYGDLFSEKYQAIVSRIKMSAEATEILDLSYSLTDIQFADIHTITENMNYEGRQIVADELVKKIHLMEVR